MVISIYGMLKGQVTLFQLFMIKFYRREKPKIECLNITGPRLAGLENKTIILNLYGKQFFLKIKNSEQVLDPSNNFSLIRKEKKMRS